MYVINDHVNVSYLLFTPHLIKRDRENMRQVLTTPKL